MLKIAFVAGGRVVTIPSDAQSLRGMMKRSSVLAGCFALALSSTLHGADLGSLWQLGDSITEGDEWIGHVGTGIDSPYPGGYRTELYSQITAAGDTYQAVGYSTENPSPLLTLAGETQHDGHAGWTAEMLTAQMQNWLRSPQQGLTSTILLIGTNNVRLGDSAADYFNNDFVPLINDLRYYRPGMHLYLAEILPLPESTAENDTVEAVNSMMPAEVESLNASGFDTTLVDTYTPFSLPDGSPNDSLFIDTVHPTAAGYTLLGDVLANAIVPEPASLTIIMLGGVLALRRKRPS